MRKEEMMMHDKSNARARFLTSLVGCAVLSGAICTQVSAQTPASNANSSSTKSVPASGRDPFRKYEAPRPVIKKMGVVTTPSIQERIEQYKAQKAAAMSARMAAPKPTTALLLEEIQVVGISRSPRGYAAIVEAVPIKLSYVVYPGERFYNGQLVAIEDNRLVFRREVVFQDGRRDRAIDIKALRPTSSVNTMTSAKSASAATGTTAETSKKSDDKPVASEKP
jgi:hypothetical protein